MSFYFRDVPEAQSLKIGGLRKGVCRWVAPRINGFIVHVTSQTTEIISTSRVFVSCAVIIFVV